MASRGSSAWRSQFWGAACKPDLVPVDFGNGVTRSVDRRAREAFQALAAVMAFFGYKVRSKDTGVYNCRKITGGSTMSSHAWATSGDFNWLTNPYRTDKLVTDMPRPMVNAITAIRTKDGVQVFRWGGDWDGRPDTKHSNYDAMHFEVIATPAELAKGIDWTTVRQAKFDKADPDTWPTLRHGDSGPTVRRLQRELNQVAGKTLVKVDGHFGDSTRRWVRSFQRSRKLTVDGVVGVGTWTALLSEQPAAKPDEPAPVKPPPAPAPDSTTVDRRKLARQLENVSAAAAKELRA